MRSGVPYPYNGSIGHGALSAHCKLNNALALQGYGVASHDDCREEACHAGQVWHHRNTAKH